MLYIGLALAGLLPAAWLIYRRRDAALVATAILAAAFVHAADWVASGIMGLYKYHPFLATDKVLDDALGVILAELIFVTSLAVLLVGLIKAWWGAVIGSMIVTALEYWFTNAGALETRGWLLWHTTVGFIIYFELVRRYWLWARQRVASPTWPHRFERMVLALLFNGLFEILLWAMHAAESPVTILGDPDKNQALMRLVWPLVFYVPVLYWVLAGRHLNRNQRLLAALAMTFAFTQILAMTGLRTLTPPWSPLLNSVVRVSFFIMAGLVDDWIRNWAKPVARNP